MSASLLSRFRFSCMYKEITLLRVSQLCLCLGSPNLVHLALLGQQPVLQGPKPSLQLADPRPLRRPPGGASPSVSPCDRRSTAKLDSSAMTAPRARSAQALGARRSYGVAFTHEMSGRCLCGALCRPRFTVRTARVTEYDITRETPLVRTSSRASSPRYPLQESRPAISTSLIVLSGAPHSPVGTLSAPPVAPLDWERDP